MIVDFSPKALDRKRHAESQAVKTVANQTFCLKFLYDSGCESFRQVLSSLSAYNMVTMDFSMGFIKNLEPLVSMIQKKQLPALQNINLACNNLEKDQLDNIFHITGHVAENQGIVTLFGNPVVFLSNKDSFLTFFNDQTSWLCTNVIWIPPRFFENFNFMSAWGVALTANQFTDELVKEIERNHSRYYQTESFFY